MYHLAVAALWGVWISEVLPAPVHGRLWFGALGTAAGVALYVLPSLLWLTLVHRLGVAETRRTYGTNG